MTKEFSSGKKKKKNSAANISAYHEPVDFSDYEALKAALLTCLRKVNKPLSMDALLKVMRLPRKAKKNIESALYELQEKHTILRTSGGWAAPSKMQVVEGALSVQRAGMGFVTRSDGKGQDIYIHPSAMGDAWHGDTVEVIVLPGRGGKNREGRISRVLRRAHAEIPAYVIKIGKGGRVMCVPANQRLNALFQLTLPPDAPSVDIEDLLLIVPGEKLGPGLWEASLSINLQHEETPLAQERLTKSAHAIPEEFPPAVKAETQGLPEEPHEEDFEGRRDLRELPFVTIDGWSARDFDDAIFVDRMDTGFKLLVAIADVSHYVAQGTALDNEARLRGNSYYFPLSVEPMLPEELSNGLCSLVQGRPRLVMVAEINFTDTAQVKKTAFYPAVISSYARLTYEQVHKVLVLDDGEEKKRLAALLPMLGEARVLAELLRGMRSKRGSLDFDLPEGEVIFEEKNGVPQIAGIQPRERLFSHRMIEEFMIAANEAVARFLEKNGIAALYRVHPLPDADKLSGLVTFLEKIGLGTAHARSAPSKKGKAQPTRKGKKSILPASPGELKDIMAKAVGTPAEYTVNRLVLRAMMQANYSTENEGHFGLASECYCHFTSPIRRYADLTIHRALKHALGLPVPGGKPLSEARLESIAEHINATERTAAEAEREIHKRMGILFLSDKIGESFDGVISGVTDFGVFVELPAVMSEGMIHIGKLDNDYYEYIPERQELRGKMSRRVFRLGQPLRVVLENVSLSRLEVDLLPE